MAERVRDRNGKQQMHYYETELYRNDLDTAIEHIVHKEQLYGKKILVTGCTGTIGSFLTDVLIQMNRTQGADVRIYAAGRQPEYMRSRFAAADRTSGEFLTAMYYDLSKGISFNCNADYVIHAAGNAHPAAFNSDPAGTLAGTVNGTLNLLEYSRQYGAARFLYLSSGEIYSSLDSISPRACYPVSKMAGENLCASYSVQYGLETVVARACHTFGPGMTGADSRAHAQFIRNSVSHENIVLKSRGVQERSYLYAADCVSALLTILINGSTGEAYDVASDSNRCTIAQLAELAARLSGCGLHYAEPDGQDCRNFSPIPRQILDGTKLSGLGWKAAFTVEKGMDHTLEILNQQHESEQRCPV